MFTGMLFLFLSVFLVVAFMNNSNYETDLNERMPQPRYERLSVMSSLK